MYRKQSFYEKYIKYIFDISCSILVIILFWWLYIIIAILVRYNLGSPVLFKQPRPGIIDSRTGKEHIFMMYKFRTMKDERDKKGNLLEDSVRLTKFGKILRASSLDELPEIFNILVGNMSFIGPRPQLVRDLVFMMPEQRMRHTARPGLSGLAQVNGRNAITWEEKINWDLEYIKKVSFIGDVKIAFQTVIKAFIKQEGINENDMATAEDFGDYLLRKGKITRQDYDKLQEKAREMLKKSSNKGRNNNCLRG